MPRVLVIEDNRTNMELTVLLLEMAGYIVISATDAETGLDMVRKERPDLVLMDVQLPGMDGLQATAILKHDQTTRSIPVVALSALAMKGDEGRIRAAGCDGYLAKPVRYKELWATVANFLPSRPCALTTGKGV